MICRQLWRCLDLQPNTRGCHKTTNRFALRAETLEPSPTIEPTRNITSAKHRLYYLPGDLIQHVTTIRAVRKARQPSLQRALEQADARVERLSADRRAEAHSAEVLVVGRVDAESTTSKCLDGAEY